LGRTLQAEKTRLVAAAEGVAFLGMPFRLKPQRNNFTRLFGYHWPCTRAMRSIRQKIREAIGADGLNSLEEQSGARNPLLRGWGQYFRHRNAHRHFQQIASSVSSPDYS
jgi:RNA-directed DNA polymerase